MLRRTGFYFIYFSSSLFFPSLFFLFTCMSSSFSYILLIFFLHFHLELLFFSLFFFPFSVFLFTQISLSSFLFFIFRFTVHLHFSIFFSFYYLLRIFVYMITGYCKRNGMLLSTSLLAYEWTHMLKNQRLYVKLYSVLKLENPGRMMIKPEFITVGYSAVWMKV